MALAVVSVELQVTGFVSESVTQTLSRTRSHEQTLTSKATRKRFRTSTSTYESTFSPIQTYKPTLTWTPEVSSTTTDVNKDILDVISEVLGPSISALLILGLAFLLGLSLLVVTALIIRDKCRSRRSSAIHGVTFSAIRKKDLKEDSSRYHTVDPTDAVGLQTEEKIVTPDQCRDTFYSDDFEEPQITYLNIDEVRPIDRRCDLVSK